MPLIRRLSGRSDLALATEAALLGHDLSENDERADYLRATLRAEAGGNIATAFPVRDDCPMISPLAKADCLLIREPFAPAAKAGSRNDHTTVGAGLFRPTGNMDAED